jgi:hypothetical protein
LLAGCGGDVNQFFGPHYIHDQCLRAEIFKDCKASIKVDPKKPNYEGLDVAIKACEEAAANQSIRHRDNVEPQCK